MKKTIIITVITLAVLGLGVVLFIQSNRTQTPQQAGQPVITNDLTSIPQSSTLLGNMQKAGLEPLSSEGTVLHIHQHLDIVINDKPVAVPADIGIASNFISAIHTHDSSGVLHVESPVQKDFTLGEFFTEWGIDFNDNQIGTYTVDQTHKLVVAVNGNPITNVQNYVLKAHDEIEIWYGDKTANPTFVKEYNFPQGE